MSGASTELPARMLSRALSGSGCVHLVRTDRSGTILSANRAFARSVGWSEEEVAGRPLQELLTVDDGETLAGWLSEGPPEEWCLLNFVAPRETPITLRCLAALEGGELWLVAEPVAAENGTNPADFLRLNNELATLTRENARQARLLEVSRRHLSETLEELETSYWHLRKLQEVLPLCLECGRVKTSESTWSDVVEYLKENEILLSHGYCPDCAPVVMERYGLEDDSGGQRER